MEVHSHYKNHLAKFYTWMLGDFETMVQRQKDLLNSIPVQPLSSESQALDLGCGPGYQSLALKKLGYKVHAVDFSSELLEELKARDSAVSTYEQNILDLNFAEKLQPEVIVCMGDTLTHLSSKDEVLHLLTKAHKLLINDGLLIISYRDLSPSRGDLDRFIHVKSDENRILTCFLEDEGDKVKVFDLLHEKKNGTWELNKSYYRKLKIPSQWLSDSMVTVGFHTKVSRLPNGMDLVIGKRLPPIK